MSDKGLPSLLDRHWAESALAIGAVIIAAVSLWMAYDTDRTNRELVASQSWPYVEVYETDTPTEPRVMTLMIANDGIGPAKLESFALLWKGKPQRNPWQLLRACCVQPDPASGTPESIASLQLDPDIQTSSDEGVVLRAGEALPFLVLSRNAGRPGMWDALHSHYMNHLTVRFCYCSAFNECWVNEQRFGHRPDLNPSRVRACPRPKVPYDN